MNRRLIILWLMALLSPCCAFAQSTSSAVKQINAIKQDTAYLYAEATMKTWEEAYSGAKAILEATIKDWAEGQKLGGKSSAYLAKADKKILNIKTLRGNYVRAFVYVRKSDIMPVGKSQDVMVINPQNSQQLPSQVEPIAQSATQQSHLTEVETKILGVTSFADVQPLVESLDEEGVLLDYGKYKTLPSTGIRYLIVYDRSGNIQASLKKDNDGNTINLKTFQIDDITNYKGCGALWLRTKE